ncbi:MAG: DHH family phosphoesterase [Desulfocapsa sp.]|nr:DHH family phosphoesterase [Desulfocapsa sp.]
MISVQAYLARVKANRNNATLVILGNEAADLDSMAASIAYGYLLNLQSGSNAVLPVMPIPRADFKLRTEAVFVFREAGIALDDVVFFDDIEFDKIMAAGAGLILLDHNKLAHTLEQYNSNVLGVIDHHRDEGLYKYGDPRIIRKVGSTASLVGVEFQKAGVEISKEIAILLCGTILLDTVNLDPNCGRLTETDLAIVEVLFPLCPLARQDFFDTIQREKFNVSGLSTADLLRKDYKEFQSKKIRYGISSIHLSVKQWEEMDKDLLSGFVKYATARKLDVLLSMNAFVEHCFSRDLIVFSRIKEVHDNLCMHLQTLSLDLLACDFTEQLQEDKGFICFYHQGHSCVSRKMLQPLLALYFNK